MSKITPNLDKPIKPAYDDCCGGGSCCPCVWDHYYAEMAKWQAQQAKLESKQEENTAS